MSTPIFRSPIALSMYAQQYQANTSNSKTHRLQKQVPCPRVHTYCCCDGYSWDAGAASQCTHSYMVCVLVDIQGRKRSSIMASLIRLGRGLISSSPTYTCLHCIKVGIFPCRRRYLPGGSQRKPKTIDIRQGRLVFPMTMLLYTAVHDEVLTIFYVL